MSSPDTDVGMKPLNQRPTTVWLVVRGGGGQCSAEMGHLRVVQEGEKGLLIEEAWRSELVLASSGRG